MLESVLNYLNNWFTVNINEGTFNIESGRLVLPSLYNGQYYRIFGSKYNDGMHQFGQETLDDETFTGTVWELSIPKNIINISERIQAYVDKEGEPSPFTSESFGGYSYSKYTNKNGVSVGWQDVFSSELAKYKKYSDYSAMRMVTK